MSRCYKLKIIFCIKILVGLCNAIVDNGTNFDHSCVEERRNCFGTKNGSIPEQNAPRVETFAGDFLLIEFNYFGTATTTTLKKVEDQELIGKNSTCFWFATSNPKAYHNVSYTPRPDMFDRIGNIEFYLNLDDFSAVTRFWNSSTGEEIYTGILKKNYTLKSVPRHFEDGVINVMKNPSQNPEVSQENFQRATSEFAPFSDEDIHQNLPKEAEADDSGPICTPKVVYAKLLISPSYNMLTDAQNSEKLIQDLIAHLHTVDMPYRLLRDPEIRLHIAGIIVPQDKYATPYMTRPDDESEINTPTMLTTTLTPKYFDEEEHRFPYHTYDTIVPLITSHRKELPMVKSGEGSRKCNIGVATVPHGTGFKGAALLAHEIGHTFNATHDEDPSDLIMTGTGAKVFAWSPNSQDELRYYFKNNACTHKRPYAVPDSVRHLQSAWLSQTGQCQNHFRDANGDCCRWFSKKKHGSVLSELDKYMARIS